MSIALVCLIPFVAALLAPLAARGGRTACALATAGASAAALAVLLAQAPAVWAGDVLRSAIPWVPQVGLSFSFFLDGLGLFFAGLILTIGVLIIVYARFYLSPDDSMGRFFAYLLLFQGAMLGVAMSDNVLLLAIFWELTSLSSFLLIGFWRQSEEGAPRRPHGAGDHWRRGARAHRWPAAARAGGRYL
jgi:multicomponent K+:H+ antiporter subunit A